MKGEMSSFFHNIKKSSSVEPNAEDRNPSLDRSVPPNASVRLPAVLSLVLGVLGGGFALWFQFWAQESYYPLSMGGKPDFELAPAVIITFELTVLMAVIGAFIGFLIAARLPQWFTDSSNEPDDSCQTHLAEMRREENRN